MAEILVIDDDTMICDALSLAIEKEGHQVTRALTLEDGLDKTLSMSFDVVMLDVHLPDGDGLSALPEIRQAPSAPEVIIITGEGDPEGAELAIRSGAWDYIEKPFTLPSMTLPVMRALQYREQEQAVKIPVALKRNGLVGNSPRFKECLDILAQAAYSAANVLITGETGTGKEIFARAIHQNSARSKENFVVVDCGALPDTLVEGILFGHEKGAFTGADATREGLIRQAHGGTLFLDEVAELPLSIQASFLRSLQERRFRPIGGKQEVESDFRLIAATNRHLTSMVETGGFRSDLLFRLRTITFGLPPLRDRVEDIQDLATYHMNRLCQRYGVGTKGFSSDFVDALASYSWPGNVRELVNTLESVLTVSRHEPMLFPKHLPIHIRIQKARQSVENGVTQNIDRGNSIVSESGFAKFRDFREATVMEAEKEYFPKLMSQVGWDIKKACKLSGLSRPRLYALLKKHNITRTE